MNDSPPLPENELSGLQKISLDVALWISSALSLAGSSIIINISRRKTHDVYHRLLLVLSVFTFFAAIFGLLVPFMNLSGTYSWDPANQQFCSAMGFFMNVSAFCVVIYSSLLSVYFLLVVRYSLSERKISRFIEAPFLIATCTFALGAGLAGLATQSFNAIGSACSFSGHPVGCADDPEVECIRGEKYRLYSLIMKVPMWIACVVGLVCTAGLYMTVLAKTRRNRRHSFHGSDMDLRERHLRDVTIQALLYSLIYINLLVWSVALAAVVKGTTKAEYGIRLCALIFLPMHGFFNSLVYLRPRYVQWRQVAPETGRFQALLNTVTCKPFPPRSSRSSFLSRAASEGAPRPTAQSIPGRQPNQLTAEQPDDDSSASSETLSMSDLMEAAIDRRPQPWPNMAQSMPSLSVDVDLPFSLSTRNLTPTEETAGGRLSVSMPNINVDENDSGSTFSS